MRPKALVSASVATVMILAAWGASRPITANARASAANPSTCSNMQLAVRSNGSNGAAGTIAVIYRLHNLRDQPCTLSGYPGVLLLDRNFHTLPNRERRGGVSIFRSIEPRLVTLAAFGNAYFVLSYNDVPVANRPCPTTRYLMIIPPNDFLPLVTYALSRGQGLTACSTYIYVSPVSQNPRYQ